jgi:hypothetical protein
METETGSSIRSCYRYIPEFITEEEEEYLLRKVSTRYDEVLLQKELRAEILDF